MKCIFTDEELRAYHTNFPRSHPVKFKKMKYLNNIGFIEEPYIDEVTIAFEWIKYYHMYNHTEEDI